MCVCRAVLHMCLEGEMGTSGCERQDSWNVLGEHFEYGRFCIVVT